MASTQYDFLIVGGGLCGLVLASRLTEDKNTTVCLLEAGGETFHNDTIDVPANLVGSWGDPNFDWTFFSTPQLDADNRPQYLPRGKSLGGSTLLNVMEVTRAPSIEYDAFEKLGAKGWNWPEFLKYMRKSESFTYSKEDEARCGMKFDLSVHGTDGPVQKRIPKQLDALALPWKETAKALGIPANPDPSNGNNVGCFIATQTIDPNSVRSSSASAYYEPVKSRPNLHVITNARVTRLVLGKPQGDKITIRGVEYSKDQNIGLLEASKEVILCAGSYQTPQILELSGIGNSEILRQHGIPVALDLKSVGENLQDHLACNFVVKLKDNKNIKTFDSLKDPEVAEEQRRLYEEKRIGLYSYAPSAFTFLTLDHFDKDGRISAAAQKLTLANDNPAAQKTFKFQKEYIANKTIPFMDINVYDRFMPGPGAVFEPGKLYLSINTMTFHTFSRGSVHIGSSDPLSNPIINLNMFDNDVDLDILVAGYNMGKKMLATEPLASLVDDVISPPPEYQSHEELRTFVKKAAGTTFHPIATVGMLPKEEGGCVDERLKVYGTHNLRVVDASIIPIHISAHLQATLYAIAEKAADLIKEDFGIST